MDSDEMMSESDLITRREAIMRVTALLGGVALVGGSALLTGCQPDNKTAATADTGAAAADAPFTTDEIAFLDEVADTILPTTSTPGAKAAKTGAFMAVMVRDSYDARDRKIFRDGMRSLDDAAQKAYKTSFVKATPAQRLTLLEGLDRDAKSYMEAQQEAERKKAAEYLPDQRKESAPGADAGAAAAVTEKPPAHYFRMMKELALLGYFTSEIGYTQAQRYVESPARFDPCVPYQPGEKSWAPHA
jgi:hypothetical protein